MRTLFLWLIFSSFCFAQSADLPVHPDTYKQQKLKIPQRTVPTEPDRIKSGSVALDGPTFAELPNPTFCGEKIQLVGDTIVYVIDRSSSMFIHPSGDGTTSRFEAAKKEASASISRLSSRLKFNIIFFDCSIMQLWENPRGATTENKQDAITWIQKMLVGGGTGTAAGVIQALAQNPAIVLLLTDGQPTCGQPTRKQSTEWHSDKIKHANLGARIDVFGIQASGEWRNFCVRIASDSSGTYFDVQ